MRLKTLLAKTIADPSMINVRCAKWWKHSVLGCNDFVKKVVCRKRSASSRKQRHCLGIANRSGNDHCCQNPDLNSKIQDFATFFTFNDLNP